MESGAAGLDEQILAGANGLALSALARGGFALSEARFTRAAREAADFLLATLRRDDGLHHAVTEGRLAGRAGLDDHAFLVAGLLDLFEADPDPRWLAAAFALQREQDARFADAAGGYFLSEAPLGPGLPRPRHARDGASPSGNAVSAWNLLRLHAYSGDAAFLERAEALLLAFGEAMRADPGAHAGLASALDAYLDGLHEVVVVLPEGADGEPLLAPLRRAFVPNRVIAIVREGSEQERLGALSPLVRGRRPLGGPTAFVCRHHVCAAPARSPERLAEQLAVFTPLGSEPYSSARNPGAEPAAAASEAPPG
jgi:uncharacterized protein YyaL (SSP411 family)